ncbi:MAG: transporter associated domain-containing protein [Pseudomonadota bacterium]
MTNLPPEPLPWYSRLRRRLFAKAPQNQTELGAMLREVREAELITADALYMMEGALRVSAMHVRDVMVPRGQMVVVPYDARPEEILPKVIESGHSRFPVISDNRDEVQGILLAKDLLEYLFNGDGGHSFNIRDLLRPATFIPESKRLNVLLREFRTNRNHMAIVVDEYGGAAGLVTIEDLIEEIVGQIDDEHDGANTVYIKQRDKGYFTVSALTPLEIFNKHFHTEFSMEEFDTIGGVLLSEFGHMPKNGESHEIDALKFEILRANKRRIIALRVIPQNK